MEPKIIAISGTSGCGKSFFVDKIINEYSCIEEIAGITTRAMRPGEIEGQSSHFITLDKFKELEDSGQLMLIKELFGNRYAWLKNDFKENSNLKIINISYKSIDELRKNGVDVFSIFIRPNSRERLIEALKQRNLSEKEYLKRINDYDESEKFLRESPKTFDMVFLNSYDEKSTNDLLKYIAERFLVKNDFVEDSEILKLINTNSKLDKKISLADVLLTYYQTDEEKGDER